MHIYPRDDSALSPVIGEMMMIVLALLLVSIFSVTLLGLLPSERSDTMDIKMSKSSSGDELTFWHKGGDWVRASDLKVVIIRDGKSTETIGSADFIEDGDSFDLGDQITITGISPSLETGNIVRLISDKNVIYSGTIE